MVVDAYVLLCYCVTGSKPIARIDEIECGSSGWNLIGMLDDATALMRHAGAGAAAEISSQNERLLFLVLRVA